MNPVRLGNFVIEEAKVPSHSLRTAQYRQGDPAISIRNAADKWTTAPFTSLQAIREHYGDALTSVEFEGRTFGFAETETRGSTTGKNGVRRSWVKTAIAYGFDGGPVTVLGGRQGETYLIPITERQDEDQKVALSEATSGQTEIIQREMRSWAGKQKKDDGKVGGMKGAPSYPPFARHVSKAHGFRPTRTQWIDAWRQVSG